MKFARWIFVIAGIYGLIVLVPMYFSENQIGITFPPAITHPEYFYGFIGVAVVWQILFFFIAFNPFRYKPIMLFAIMEKFVYGVAVIILFKQGRIAAMMLSPGIIDLLLGCLFAVAFLKTKEEKKKIVKEEISETKQETK